MTKTINDLHISVLLHELVDNIEVFKDKQNIIVDCTLWMWGHAKKIIDKMNSWDIFIGFDADIVNLNIVRDELTAYWKAKQVEVKLINSNFVNLKQELQNINIDKITWIYYDLWLSSLHVDDETRWFSFRENWPLDMRFDKTSWITASDILNKYSEDDIFRILQEYWEEPLCTKITREIITKRKTWFKFETTLDLASLIEKFSYDSKTKARVFQALRIEVNQELDNTKISIKDAISMLEKDWIIFVISFHSLEDRLVKNIFRDESRDCICSDIICTCKHTKQLKILTKKPIEPTEEEMKSNKRSRSAKARCAIKL